MTYEYEMVVRKDMTINETAMARATANTISVVAQMIGAGAITEHGVFRLKQSCQVIRILKRWQNAAW